MRSEKPEYSIISKSSIEHTNQKFMGSADKERRQDHS